METGKISEMIGIYPQEGFLPCPVAHYITAFLGVSPRDVGDAATAMKVRLELCQLGLFGYGRKGKSRHKITGRPVEVPEEALALIRARAREGGIACRELWDIAAQAGITRPEAGNAADSLGLKIGPCQLGAFRGKEPGLSFASDAPRGPGG